MGHQLIAFDKLDWQPGNHPLETKKNVGSVTLLRFEPGFEDPSWCPNGHIIHVITGSLELSIEDHGTITVSAGNACTIDAGTRHQARNVEDHTVEMFIVSS